MTNIALHEKRTPHIDQELDHEFRLDFGAGRRMAEDSESGSIRKNLTTIDTLSAGNLPEIQLATATLMLTSINTIASLRSNNSMPLPRANSVRNQALADIMLLAEGTSITKDMLADACVKYCRKTNLLTGVGSELEYRKTVESYIEGVWYEQSFNNLALASGVLAEQATHEEDLSGVDIWLGVSKSDFVGVDVKVNKRAIELFADKRGIKLSNLFEFKTDAPRGVQPFTIHLAVDTTGEHVFVAMDNMPRSPGVSAMDFRSRLAEQTCFKELLAKLKELASAGSVPTYGKRPDQ